MTAADLLAHVRSRGVTLRLRFDGKVEAVPAGRLTDDERAAIKACIDDVKALLRDEDLDVSASTCRLCAGPLALVEGWPVGPEWRWLCPTCAAWPASALAEAFALLTGDERDRFDQERAAGDRLAQVVYQVLDRAEEPVTVRSARGDA